MLGFSAVYSQEVIVGDMNDDNELNISDVTTMVSTILGKTSIRKIAVGGGDPYKIDNSYIIGTWRTTDGKTMSFNEDGTTNVGTGYKYSFLPNQGFLIILKADGSFACAYNVLNRSDDYILLNPIGTIDGLFYYTSANFVTAIKISDTSIKLKTGQTYQLSVIGDPEGAIIPSLKWTSSSTTVAAVDQTGKVTAKKGGKATITATSTENANMKVTCSVDITQLVTSVTISETALAMAVGEYYEISATANPSTAANKELKWTCSNTSVVKIYDDFIKAVGVGTANITVAATDGSGKKAICKVTVFDEAPKSITLNAPSTILYGESSQITATISPTSASSATIQWSSSDDKIATVDQKGNVTAGNEDGRVTITAKINGTTSIEGTAVITIKEDSQHDYVDLGLPSGTMWATCNLGATKPTEAGDCYAWGDVEPKIKYLWSTYFDTKDEGNSFIKYSITKTKILEAENDAATINWGEKWCMPTAEQWQELIDNCVWVYGGYGFYVYKKKDNSSSYSKNDIHIFIPYSRYAYDTNINYNSYCLYWSSSIASQSSEAITFNASYNKYDSTNYLECYSTERYSGYGIRPVRKKIKTLSK